VTRWYGERDYHTYAGGVLAYLIQGELIGRLPSRSLILQTDRCGIQLGLNPWAPVDLVLVPVSLLSYHYEPSVIATIPFAVLFALTSVIHIWQMIRPRTWYMIPFIIGALCISSRNIANLIANKTSRNIRVRL
jgi:hypothetical protein